MLNGKKFAEEKKMFFGAATKSASDLEKTKAALEAHNATLNIEEAERCKETIVVKQNPLYAVFAYYRYYVLMEKYKAIVRFNLNHKAYFGKRDAILELANDQALSPYWKASILSFVCVWGISKMYWNEEWSKF